MRQLRSTAIFQQSHINFYVLLKRAISFFSFFFFFLVEGKIQRNYAKVERYYKWIFSQIKLYELGCVDHNLKTMFRVIW